jgi:hypothetical protein
VHEVKGSKEERNLWLKSIAKRKVVLSVKKNKGLSFTNAVIGKVERPMCDLTADTPHEEDMVFEEGRVHVKVTMVAS